MKTDTMLLIGAGIGAYLLINSMTKGEISQAIGESAGNTVGAIAIGVPGGIVKGAVGELQSIYNWSRYEAGYIPIIDEAAQFVAGIKNWGNPDVWFG